MLGEAQEASRVFNERLTFMAIAFCDSGGRSPYRHRSVLAKKTDEN